MHADENKFEMDFFFLPYKRNSMNFERYILLICTLVVRNCGAQTISIDQCSIYRKKIKTQTQYQSRKLLNLTYN